MFASFFATVQAFSKKTFIKSCSVIQWFNRSCQDLEGFHSADGGKGVCDHVNKNPANILRLRKSQFFKKQTRLLRSLQSQRTASVTPLPGCIGKVRSTQGLSTKPPSWLEAITILTSVSKLEKFAVQNSPSKCHPLVVQREALDCWLWNCPLSFVGVDASRLPFLFGNIIPGTFFLVTFENSLYFHSYSLSPLPLPLPSPLFFPFSPLSPSPFLLNLFPSLKVL